MTKKELLEYLKAEDPEFLEFMKLFGRVQLFRYESGEVLYEDGDD